MISVRIRKSTALLRLRDRLSDLLWHEWADIKDCAGVRYGARILELKRLGYRIESRSGLDGKWYRLTSLARGQPKPKRVKIYLSERDASDLLVARPLPESALRAIQDALLSYREHRECL